MEYMLITICDITHISIVTSTLSLISLRIKLNSIFYIIYKVTLRHINFVWNAFYKSGIFKSF